MVSKKQLRIEAEISETAERLINAGLSVILVLENRMALAIQKYHQGMSLDDIKGSYRQNYVGGKARLLGVLTGIGGIECLEVDSASHTHDFMAKFERDLPDVYNKVILQLTRSKCAQIVYRIEGGVVPERQELAFIRKSVPNAGWYTINRDGEVEPAETLAKDAQEVKGTPGDWYCDFLIIRTRGPRDYFECPPSEGWEILNGDLCDLPTITPEEREKLLSIARGFDSTERELIVHENGETEWVDDQPDTLPSKKYNRVSAGEEVVVLLKKHGWRVVKRNSYNCSLLRHGVDVEPTACVRWVDGALNTLSYHVLEFERGREHSPIEVLAILEHGGDVAKAAKALDEGHSKKAG